MIRATVDATVLGGALREGIAQSKGTLLVLGHALIEADADGLRITTTDLRILVATRIDASVTETGKVCVSVDLLAAAMTGGGLVELIEESGRMVVKRAPRSRVKVATLPAADWPQPENVTWRSAGLNTTEFARAVNTVEYAVGRGDVRPYCSAVCVRNDWVAGTDGHRLALVAGEFGDNQNLLIPIEAVARLQRALADGGDICLGAAKPGEISTLAVITDRQRVEITLLASSNIPDFRRMIPCSEAVGEFECDAKALLVSTKRIRNFCGSSFQAGTKKYSEFGARLVLSGGVVAIESTNGDNRDELAVDAVSECMGSMNHAVQVNYLADFLESCGTERARIACHADANDSSALRFVLQSVGSETNATHIIAGYRA